ncbi:uncharacterized protein LOC117524342 [Thalassophryne amazonica]|uniref:uncharacterized protein LOC117524342 n=1 Tax=Thalassophryne amazonica TaxID=390379 RepID=UPI001471A0A7|nr:uncharacterized protein LOC117524342 [Thalassophryne amazonica]
MRTSVTCLLFALDSEKSVSDGPEVASPGSPLEEDADREPVSVCSPEVENDLDADVTPQSDREELSCSDEQQDSTGAEYRHQVADILREAAHVLCEGLLDVESPMSIFMAQQEILFIAQKLQVLWIIFIHVLLIVFLFSDSIALLLNEQFSVFILQLVALSSTSLGSVPTSPACKSSSDESGIKNRIRILKEELRKRKVIANHLIKQLKKKRQMESIKVQ